MLLGQITAELKSVTKALNDNTVIVHETQLEMGRYWAGLENANKDIRRMSSTQEIILKRLDNSVPIDRFEKLEQHVKTLNGTDGKFRMLGIDINDPKSVEEWRESLNSMRARSRLSSGIRNRVIQGIALAIAMAVGAAAWNGIKDGILSDRTVRQEQTK